MQLKQNEIEQLLQSAMNHYRASGLSFTHYDLRRLAGVMDSRESVLTQKIATILKKNGFAILVHAEHAPSRASIWAYTKHPNFQKV